MNLRKNIFILFISFISVNLFAQNEVSFRSLTLEEAIKKAGEENKMIFIDCYTTWCGPCKRLSKETFTDSLFADYINNKFIALKFDCEKEEGINIKTDYNVGAFPTLLYLDSEGNEVFRTTGFDKAEPLITKIESGTSKENGLLALEKKYNAGNREYSFLMKYIEMLSMAYKNDEISKIVEDYLNDKAEELISNDEYFGLFVKYISDPKHVSTSVVFNNRAEFCNKYGEKVVNSKLSNIWYVNGNKISGNRTIAKEEKAALLNEYINWLRSSGIEDVDKMENYFYITFSNVSKEWKDYCMYVEKYMKNYSYSDMELYNWGLRIQMDCQDKKYRKTAVKWCEKRIKEIEKEQKKQTAQAAQNSFAANSFNYSDIYKKMIANLND